VINSIEVNKTFNPRLYGDVAGANVNILSKDLLEDQELLVSGSIGANFQTMGKDFYRADGNNFLGISDNDIPVNNLSQYNFKNSLNLQQIGAPLLNHSVSLSGGKTFELSTGSLEVFAVASSSGDFFYTNGRVSQTNTVGDFRQDLTFNRYEYTATQFALGNVSYQFANKSNIAYNALYVHTNRQSVNDYRGFSINGTDDISNPNAYDNIIRRQQTNNNVLFVNQLISNVRLNRKFSLDLSASLNTIRGNEPDRRTNFYIGDGSGESYHPNNSAPAFNHRFFSTLHENEVAANGSVIYQLNESSANNRLVVGYNYRLTDRDFDFVQFNFNNMVQNVIMNPDNADDYYNQQNISNGTIRMETSRGFGSEALIPLFYTGDRSIHGGVFQLEYDLTSSLSVTTGARVESVKQDIGWSVSGDIIRPEIPGDNLVERNDFYVLPNLNLKYSVSENDQFRLAASRTYTYPQFK
ncbi:MAG TPA: TonB-dependent receptor, partial [Cyclobacteriaceae bacterium]|nr:TonB-dependent receptor [Cyclobacteriaceae bacterium]